MNGTFRVLFDVTILLAAPFAHGLAQDIAPKPPAPVASKTLDEAERRVIRLYAKALPSVVTIQTATRRSGLLVQSGLGSGVVISKHGHLLTAEHVVSDEDVILVKGSDGVPRPASILFSEPGADVALLKLDQPPDDLVPVVMGDSETLAVGQSLYVIGSPRGLENTLTSGLLSGFRDFNRLYDGTIRVRFLQTDAAINSGNSGGPVFDSGGQLVGIASRISTSSGGSEGLGFVVAINGIRKLLALEGRTWTGFQGVFLSKEQLATLFNMDREGGLLVQRVVSGSPADQAGLRAGTYPVQYAGQTILLGGDLILEVGDQVTCHGYCLEKAEEHMKQLDRIAITYLRGGVERSVQLDVSQARRNFLLELR
ncbi:MAG: trypsin-like peptidase domain-containing protein [Planctomycetes bacterium]|nr:trypsin-like peptidase domain-containing protein [Planctomycetota bacterium]